MQWKLWSFKLTIQRHDECLDEVNALVVPLVDRAGARGVRELINLYHGAVQRAVEAEDLSLKYARELERTQSLTFPSMQDIAMYPHTDGSKYPISNVNRIPGPIERQALRQTGYDLGVTKAEPVYQPEVYGLPYPSKQESHTERLDAPAAEEMAFEPHPKECPDCGSRMAMAPMRPDQEPDTVGVECTGFPGSDSGCGYRKVLHREKRTETP